MTEPHPLFLLEEGDDQDEEPPEVGAIHVRRLGAGGWLTHPRTFEPHELQSLEQLHMMCGGGTYELIARGASRQRISAKRTFTLPGAPLPFAGNGEPAASAPASAPSLPAGADPNTAMFLAMMQMMAQQSQQQTQLMIAAMQQQGTQTVAMLQALAGKNDGGGMGEVLAASMAQTTAIMQAALASKDSQNPAEMLTTGLEMGASMARAGAEAAAASGPDPELSLVVEGMKAMQGMGAGPGSPPPAPNGKP